MFAFVALDFLALGNLDPGVLYYPYDNGAHSWPFHVCMHFWGMCEGGEQVGLGHSMRRGQSISEVNLGRKHTYVQTTLSDPIN